MKDVGLKKGALVKRIGAWAKGIGLAATINQLEGRNVPFCYSLANLLVFKNIRKALGLDLCKMFLYGAAPLKKQTREYFSSLNIPLQNCYGMSETSGLVSASLNKPHWNNLNAAGTPIPGCHIKIDKKNPEEKEGEIVFKGRNMFMGYLKNEAETRKAIDNEGFVHSGDIGYFDSKGFLHITGRLKELIITAGGENVAPILIEDKLKELCPLLSNVMVIGDDRKYLAAILTIKGELDLVTGLGNDKLPDQVVSVLVSEGVLKPGEKPAKPTEIIRDQNYLDYIESKVKILNDKHVISRAQ